MIFCHFLACMKMYAKMHNNSKSPNWSILFPIEWNTKDKCNRSSCYVYVYTIYGGRFEESNDASTSLQILYIVYFVYLWILFKYTHYVVLDLYLPFISSNFLFQKLKITNRAKQRNGYFGRIFRKKTATHKINYICLMKKKQKLKKKNDFSRNKLLCS